MKIQKQLGYLALMMTAGSLALPVNAFAEDAAPAAPASSESMQMAAPQEAAPQEAPKPKKHHVKKHHKKKCHYKMHRCHKYWKHCCMRKVCQIKPAHWWGLTWIPTHKECWWVKAR